MSSAKCQPFCQFVRHPISCLRDVGNFTTVVFPVRDYEPLSMQPRHLISVREAFCRVPMMTHLVPGKYTGLFYFLRLVGWILSKRRLTKCCRCEETDPPINTNQSVYQTPESRPPSSPKCHYNDVIMGAIASQITSLMIVYSIVYSAADQRKHQSSASLAFVRGIHRGPVNCPHKWPVTRKMFSSDDVIMVLMDVTMQATRHECSAM